MAVSHRGAISFGMVYIPVGLYTATQDNDIHFNQLCKDDGSRVKYKKVCSGCGKEIGSGDIVKGFEYEKGKYVTLTDDDFEKAKSEKDRTIHILHFTDLPKDNGMTSIVLGQYRGSEQICKGNVTLGVSGDAYQKIRAVDRLQKTNIPLHTGDDHTVWIKPKLVCTVKYMMKNASGSLRQPVFKGLRKDKQPEECQEV